MLPLIHPSLLEGRRFTRRGARLVYREHSQLYQQGFRVADSSLDLYQLYVGEDGPPSFSNPPVATSATLPFSWAPTPPGAGTRTLYCVVRKTNAYGLQSLNIQTFRVRIDSGGSQVLLDPSAPIEVQVFDDESGYLRVVARYNGDEDPDKADTWRVFVDTVLPDPDRSSGPDFEEEMFLQGGSGGRYAQMTAKVGPFAPGTLVYVIVTAYRSSDGAYGEASPVSHTLIEAFDLEDGMLFGGEAYEQL